MAISQQTPTTDTPTADRVLLRLKSLGSQSAKQLACTFEMTSMGAHKVLSRLMEEGLVHAEDVAEGRGRPTRYFRLSAKGHARFPDRHQELTAEMLTDIKSIFGMEGINKLIAEREARQAKRYAGLVSLPLSKKVDALAKLRSEEGYMARAETSEDGTLLLIEDHCPICAAATACQGFCKSELDIFQSVLGDDVTISREEHVPSGGRRCTYRISNKDQG